MPLNQPAVIPARDLIGPEPSPPNGTNDTIGTGDCSPAVAGWREAVAGLDPSSPPEPLSLERWRQMLTDAECFLTRWGEAAAAFGWTELELFGVSPGFSRRLDRDGLLYALEGRAVVLITAEAAAIGAGGGKSTRYYRMERPGAVAWWRA